MGHKYVSVLLTSFRCAGLPMYQAICIAGKDCHILGPFIHDAHSRLEQDDFSQSQQWCRYPRPSQRHEDEHPGL